MGNPLLIPIDIPGIGEIDIVGAGRDVVEDILKGDCGLFPTIKPGQQCVGIPGVQIGSCCFGTVIGGAITDDPFVTGECPPGTFRGSEGNCLPKPGFVFDEPPNGNGNGNGARRDPAVQKICCPSGFKQKADGTPVCVKTRKTNFGNIQAARRAVRRLGGAQRALRSIEALVDKTVKPRKAARAPRRRACKTACSCG